MQRIYIGLMRNHFSAAAHWLSLLDRDHLGFCRNIFVGSSQKLAYCQLRSRFENEEYTQVADWRATAKCRLIVE